MYISGNRTIILLLLLTASTMSDYIQVDEYEGCLAEDGSPLCIQTLPRQTCDSFNMQYLCEENIGCTWDGATFYQGSCDGLRAPCHTFDQDSCPSRCSWYADPPCPLDTFHEAISPLHLSCAQVNIPDMGVDVGCDKVRPSVDGEVLFQSFYVSDFLQATCFVYIDGQICDECKMCDIVKDDSDYLFKASFDCSNLIQEDVSDDECPEGERCVGQDCDGNCVCRTVNLVDVSPAPMATNSHIVPQEESTTESSTESPTGLPTEPPTEPPTSPHTESLTEPPAEPPTEPPIIPLTKLKTEPPTTPPTESLTESPTDAHTPMTMPTNNNSDDLAERISEPTNGSSDEDEAEQLGASGVNDIGWLMASTLWIWPVGSVVLLLIL